MAAANLNTIRSTIEGRLATELAVAPVLPVVFHNQPYVPTPNSSWVQCLVSFGANEYLTLGGTTGSSNSIIGIVAINIYTPKGVGPGANLTIGERIRNLFNRQIVSGLHIDPPIGPEVVASPTPEGYFQTQLRMTFETFEDL
jgi:hypothetical protein